MSKVPSAVWIVDTKKEHIAVGEARKLKIPVVAILDTNCDPDEVDYPIPGNDDAIRSANLLTRVIADAVADGLLERAGGQSTGTEAEPLAEWEAELLSGAATESTPAPSATETTEGQGVDAAAAAPEATSTEAPATEAAAAPEATEAPATEAPAADAAPEAPATEAPQA